MGVKFHFSSPWFLLKEQFTPCSLLGSLEGLGLACLKVTLQLLITHILFNVHSGTYKSINSTIAIACNNHTPKSCLFEGSKHNEAVCTLVLIFFLSLSYFFTLLLVSLSAKPTSSRSFSKAVARSRRA